MLHYQNALDKLESSSDDCRNDQEHREGNFLLERVLNSFALERTLHTRKSLVFFLQLEISWKFALRTSWSWTTKLLFFFHATWNFIEKQVSWAWASRKLFNLPEENFYENFKSRETSHFIVSWTYYYVARFLLLRWFICHQLWCT